MKYLIIFLIIILSFSSCCESDGLNISYAIDNYSEKTIVFYFNSDNSVLLNPKLTDSIVLLPQSGTNFSYKTYSQDTLKSFLTPFITNFMEVKIEDNLILQKNILNENDWNFGDNDYCGVHEWRCNFFIYEEDFIITDTIK